MDAKPLVKTLLGEGELSDKAMSARATKVALTLLELYTAICMVVELASPFMMVMPLGMAQS